MAVTWIVSGPSSAGKTAFLKSPACSGITGLPTGAPVALAWQVTRDIDLMHGDLYMHYNILRPVHLRYMKMRRRHRAQTPLLRSLWPALRRQLSRARSGLLSRGTSFADDPAWQRIRDHPQPKEAIVLVASYDELVRRVERRSAVEALSSEPQGEREYARSCWLDIYRQVDLLEIYMKWCRELDRCGIAYRLLDSTSRSYSTVEGVTSLGDVLYPRRRRREQTGAQQLHKD